MTRLGALLLAASAFSPAAADPRGALDMLGFFSGHTHADNVIKIAFHGPHKLVVDSIGGRNKDGEFVLIDNVQEEGKAPRKRTWVMRPDGPDHFTGTLSDSSGPVDVTIAGSSATIRYTMKDGGMKIEQQLQLEANGTISNHVIAKKYGMKFAEVEGTIRKLD